MDSLQFRYTLLIQMGCKALAAAIASWVAWSGGFEAMAAALVLPVLCFEQPRRSWAGVTALLYYIVALWPLAATSYLFFHFHSRVAGVLMVIAFGVLLSLPWYLLWRSRGSVGRRALSVRLLFALWVTALPPLGIFAVAHPLTATGVLLPATGFAGIVVICGAYILWFYSRAMAIGGLAVAALLAHSVRPPGSLPPPDWMAVSTHFGSVYDASDPLPDFEAAEFMQRVARTSNANVVVFPEGVVRRWNESTDLYWRPAIDDLRSQGKVILVGAAVRFSDDPRDTDRFRNVIMIRGAMNREFAQHVPVPIAMWNPYRAPLNLTGPFTITIHGKRTAILICYEQLIPWAYLNAVLHGADLFVGAANSYWIRGTAIPQVQQNTLKAWSRLFDISLLSAVNE